jgi:heme/copper-type cytochrome/quinol oxidase subunit 4
MWRRKRRSELTVLVGVVLMAVALFASAHGLGTDATTTLAALAGFALVNYGVHLAWVVFCDRESDGPAS